jgi:hypothetical protein
LKKGRGRGRAILQKIENEKIVAGSRKYIKKIKKK